MSDNLIINNNIKCYSYNIGLSKNLLFILNRSILLSIIIFFSSINLYAQVEKDTVKILHISDPHVVYQLSKTHPIFAGLRKHLIGSEDSLNNFLKIIPPKVNADAVIITGDLIDYYKAEISKECETAVSNQVEQFKKIYENSKVPLYLTLGNHDISYYEVNEQDSEKVEIQYVAKEAKASFIRNIECFRNGTYYKKKYTVGKTNYHLFFLDNGYYNLNDLFDPIQLDWVRDELKKIGNEPVLMFFHRYYPIGDVNGDGIAIKKNRPTDWPKKQDCSSGMLKIINEHKNIKAMFVGHQHNNSWEGIKFPNGQIVYEIMTSALFKGTNNWRLIKFTESNILVSKPGILETEIKISN